MTRTDQEEKKKENRNRPIGDSDADVVRVLKTKITEINMSQKFNDKMNIFSSTLEAINGKFGT